MLLDIIAAFLISIICGMGMGSAGLMVIYLTLVRGFDQLSAQGANLLLFIASAAFSLILQIKNGTVRYRIVGLMILSGAIGTFIGYEVAHIIDPSIVRTVFACLLIFSGTLSGLRLIKEGRKPKNPRKRN